MDKELEERIDNANSIEELNAIEEEVKTAEEVVPEEPKAEEEKAEETEVKITPEEERKLIKKTEQIEERQLTNLVEIKGEQKMEVRNSKEYVEAYAEYCKGNKDAKELRALITTGGTGDSNSKTVEVPDMVYDFVKTAWEKAGLMQRVRRVSVKGNLKVQFEVSADGAVKHTEGDTAVSEESLVLGIVTLTPVSIKKWISLSDEVLDMRGEEFLRYIYDEIVYRIAKKCEDELIGIIKALPQSLSANESGVYDKVSANKITVAPGVDTIAQAIANLSDETNDITIVMNKLTYADFKQAQYSNGYGVDVFEGCTIVFNNTLPAYSTAIANQVYAIVGDFNHGALANYPEGDDIAIKYDDKTQMTADLVRILGRRYVGMNAVADKSFTLIAKPTSL